MKLDQMRWSLIAWWQARKSPKNRCTSWILLGLSKIYAIFQMVDYRCKHMRRAKAPIFVMSLGSPRAGGSGKTPLVRALMEWLDVRVKAVVISRGYASQCKGAHLLTYDCAGASIVGDEPWMLSGFATNNQPLSVIVAKKRLEGCKLAASLGFQVAVLDDGMQHYQLSRNLDIAVVSREDFEDTFLPAGRLREPLDHVKRCDWIFVRRYHQLSETQKKRLHSWGLPWLSFDLVSSGVHLVLDDIKRPWNIFQGVYAVAFAAIALPENFFALLRSQGVHLLDTWALADHQPIDEEQLRVWMERYKSLGASVVFCSEKDVARLTQAKSSSWPLPLVWPQWCVKWEDGSDAFFEYLSTQLSL